MSCTCRPLAGTPQPPRKDSSDHEDVCAHFSDFEFCDSDFSRPAALEVFEVFSRPPAADHCSLVLNQSLNRF